ncbi:hypothetical protein ACFORG_19935 [Lutimaribacter marinistellae]|uniref:DUF3618 domain-containing protein n=1 Tax=Lutimaribacter marinistellae TaxID=1820329 RepID=A0ABV7TNC0_9RHOB
MSDEIDRLEKDLQRERDSLRQKLEELENSLSPGRLIDRAGDLVANRGEQAIEATGELVRNNKAATALIGAGIAWLAISASAPPRKSAAISPPSRRPSAAYDTRETPAVQGLRDPDAPVGNFDARVAAAEGAAHADRLKGEPPMTTYADPTDPRHHAEPQGFRDRLQAAQARAVDSAANLRSRIEDGLGDLPEEARARVRRARAAAIDAQVRIEEQASEAARRARSAAHENPLLIGALAFAAGAALAAALPRTTTENRYLGAHRDRLFDEADRVMREEMENLKARANAAAIDAKEAAKDALRSEGDTPGAAESPSKTPDKKDPVGKTG